MLATRTPPVDVPMPDGWRAERGEGGVAVYVNDATGESTIERCASPRCRCPFVAKNAKQRTCGKRRCLWAIREENPTRIKAKKNRFDRWYKDPTHRESHVATTIAGRRRRKIAAEILVVLSARDGAAQIRDVYSLLLGPIDLVREALTALWYVEAICVEGETIKVRTTPTRYLRLPPASVEVPATLDPMRIEAPVEERIRWLLAGRNRGMTAEELAEAIGTVAVIVEGALRQLRGRLCRFRRTRSGARSYRLAKDVQRATKGKSRQPAKGDGSVTPSTHGGRADPVHGPPAGVAQARLDPWTLSSPSYGSHLPGAGLVLHLAPRPAHSIELGQVRALHGLLTNILDEPHDPRAPAWSLIPWDDGCGWGVYLRREEHVHKVALREHQGTLFDRPIHARFSQPVRLRAPAPRAPGRYLLRIDAVTPVCIRSNGRGSRTVHLTSTAESLLSAITQAFPSRIGLDGFDPSTAILRMVSKETQPELVRCGEHLGVIRGWTGSVIVEANAVAAWLLDVAGRIGLGGRVALGFGRVRVSPAVERRPIVWTIVDAAVRDYVRNVGIPAGQARRAMLLELQHARPVGRPDDRPRTYEGPPPTNARYLVLELDEERRVVGMRVEAP